MNAIKHRVAVQGLPVAVSVPAALTAEPALSLFHQAWFLDVVTGGAWAEAVVRQDAAIVGRLPYAPTRAYGLEVATMPPLTVSLGPAIVALPGKAATTLRRRLEITNALIDQLPEFAYFEQVFDPSVRDAAAFVYRGFVAGAADCFRIPQGRAPHDVWCDMTAARRQEILDTADALLVAPLDDVEEFIALDRAIARRPHKAGRLRGLLPALSERDAGCMLGVRDRSGRLQAATVLAWDNAAAYRLIGARRAGASDVAESLLLWEAMGRILPRGLAFDLGGIESLASLRCLAGFGDYLTPRVRVHRVTAKYRLRKAVGSRLGPWAF